MTTAPQPGQAGALPPASKRCRRGHCWQAPAPGDALLRCAHCAEALPLKSVDPERFARVLEVVSRQQGQAAEAAFLAAFYSAVQAALDLQE